MNYDFQFEASHFDALIGGVSVLDIPWLNIQNLEQAYEFLSAYGFNKDSDADIQKLWAYHRQAVKYIRTELLNDKEVIPESLSDPNQLRDICYLLIYASTKDNRENSLQRWSCAILRVMHVMVHLDNDLFTRYSSEIQDQILKPFQSYIIQDADLGILLGDQNNPERIPLKKFDIKPFKTSKSSVTKLLAKPEEVAFALLDKIGVRFVTKHLFDVFRVMRFLIRQHLVSFPHVIPDQSNNTLFPANLFMEVMEGLTKGMDLEVQQIDQLLCEKLETAKDRAKFKEKLNIFSSKEYSFIKFIARRLVKVQWGDQVLPFFYPFEIQIVDYETYQKNLTGPSSHDEYKRRQIGRARLRTLGREPLA